MIHLARMASHKKLNNVIKQRCKMKQVSYAFTSDLVEQMVTLQAKN